MAFPDLTYLMQCYFHQDWDLEYSSTKETVVAFKEGDPDRAVGLATDLDELLKDHDDEQVESIVLAMNCDLTPEDQTYRQWMEEIREFA